MSELSNEACAPTLQLLIVDMGDCCVVKVEKGDVAIQIGDGYWLVTDGMTQIVHKPFADLRAALDGEKPVPRIESNGEGGYHFIVAGREDSWLTGAEYDALCEIAGHKLPVYEGGKWEPLLRSVQDKRDGNYIDSVVEVGIWRYTR